MRFDPLRRRLAPSWKCVGQPDGPERHRLSAVAKGRCIRSERDGQKKVRSTRDQDRGGPTGPSRRPSTAATAITCASSAGPTATDRTTRPCSSWRRPNLTGVGCYQTVVIASMHAATGATIGAAVGSPIAAALLGLPVHLAGDRVPHRDIRSRRFEVASGVAIVGLLAARRGITDAATVGALAACAPDIEHLVRLPRPGGSKLFHGKRGWHRSGRLSARAQLLIAGCLTGRLLVVEKRNRRPAA